MKKIAITMIVLVMFFLSPLQTTAIARTTNTIDNVSYLTNKLEMKIETEGFVADDDEDLLLLENELNKLGVTSESYSSPQVVQGGMVSPFGYGESHYLGNGWSARVDKPLLPGDTKPHIHVEKGGIKAAENVDGTKSHGKTLASSGVPAKIRTKAKNLADYKKGQKDWNNMKKAKTQILNRKLNLRKTADIIIAIGIFVAVVGFLLFAAGSTGIWASFLILI